MTPEFNSLQKTRDGTSFRIYATDGANPYAIHGAVWRPEGWIAYEWTASGFVNQDGTPHELDLMGGIERETPRCAKCRGTGVVGEAYCSCDLGRDLAKVETRFGAIEGLVN